MKTYKYQLNRAQYEEFYPIFKKLGIKKEEGPKITCAEYWNIFVELSEQEKGIIDKDMELSRERDLAIRNNPIQL